MIPLFKSDYSIGKSLLTLNHPSKNSSTSVFDLVEEYDLKEVCLVEDTLTGFLSAFTSCESLGIPLRFGLRLSLCSDLSHEVSSETAEHKIVIFALNAEGCKLLNQIYSVAFTKGNGRIDSSYLSSIWNDLNLKLAVPFYDSFIFNNLMSFNNCVMDFDFTDPTFFIEDNDLPFDNLIRDKIMNYTSSNNYKNVAVKSIYYDKRSDFEAYQTYKCICSRSSYGRGSSLQKPNLDHCSSKEFCMESWSEQSTN